MVRYEVNAVIDSMVENSWRGQQVKTKTCFAEKGNSKEALSRSQGAKSSFGNRKQRRGTAGRQDEAAKGYIRAPFIKLGGSCNVNANVKFVTPKGVLPLALCHASATHEGP